MTAHTPGPWVVAEQDESYDFAITTEDGFNIASTFSLEERSQEPANARLIAAAPDLMAALELAFCAPETNFGKARDIARAAIAKARGTP